MARQSTEINNEDLHNFFSNFENYWEISDWLQDVLYGASRSGHSRPSSPYALFQALRTLSVISLETVDRFVNIKSQTIDGRSYSRSHVYAFMTRLIYARKAILFHYEKRTGSSFASSRHYNSNIVGDFCYFDGLRRSEINS